MEKNDEKKYVFNEVEDAEKLDSEELKQYAKELEKRLAEAKADATTYKQLWYKNAAKMDAIMSDVDMLKKLFNLITERWK